MTGIEIYKLILDTFIAFGTVGAVCISLWAVLRKQPPFAIRDIQVATHTVMRTGGMRKTGPAQETSYSLRLTIENFRDTRMQIFSASINADHSRDKKSLHQMSMGFSAPDIFIPERSIYTVQYQLDSKSMRGTYSNAKEITLTLSTSFGDKTVSFPEEWRLQLYEAVEQSERLAA